MSFCCGEGILEADAHFGPDVWEQDMCSNRMTIGRISCAFKRNPDVAIDVVMVLSDHGLQILSNVWSDRPMRSCRTTQDTLWLDEFAIGG